MTEPRLEVEGATRSFGSVVALDSVSLTVEPGEFLTLLGPSGCGKTTLLRVVAGFETLDNGSVRIQGRDVLPLPPERRPVNLVFQRYALFPHLTVWENVAFGLRVAGMTTAEADRRVGEALGTVSLEGYGSRHVDELSGGQQQRVAVARAIVNEPQLLLLDEPLGALDLQLRKTMQSELRSLQRRLGTTFLYVTHDQEEALVLSDRIAILEHGHVAQVGTPEEIYRQPATRFVARFVGDTNLLPAPLSGGMANGEDAISVRPEDVSLDGSGEVRVEGVVADVVFLGPVHRVIVDVGSATPVKADCAHEAGADLAPGDRVTTSWNRADCTVVP